MKFIKSTIMGVLAVCAVGLTGCNDWLDVNTNPNTPTAESAQYQLRLPWCQHYLVANYDIVSSFTSYICGQMVTTTRAENLNAMRWNFGGLNGSTRTANAQQWFFVPCASNLQDMYDKAMADGAYHYAGAAKMMKAYGFMLMTDLFGEIPYDEALGEAIAPKYNTGDEVFDRCIDDIEEAIELFSREQSATAQPLSVGDIWNGGDASKWLKMCYLLKARWLNHLTKKQAGNYKDGKYDADEILACLDKALKSNADNTVNYAEDYNSSSHDVQGWNEPVDYASLYSVIGMNSNRYFVSKYFYDNLTNFDGKGIEDPRADKFIPWVRSRKSANTPAKIKWSDDGKWRRSLGVDLLSDIVLNGGPYASTYNKKTKGWYCDGAAEARLGDTIYVQGICGSTGYGKHDTQIWHADYADDNSSMSGFFSARPTSPTVVASFAECCFIKAEVLLRKGDKAGAFAAYKEGIKAHIDYVNQVCAKWVAEDKDLAECPSFAPYDQAVINNFLANGIGTSGDITMGKIMTQKQIAMIFTQEQWNDFRKMDYDTNVFMGWDRSYQYLNTASYHTSMPLDKRPRRLRQASYEVNYNFENLEAIGARVPGALDLPVGTNGKWYLSDQISTLPIWWDSTQE